MIRTILFDMGNVLVHFSHELMCEQMAQTSAEATESMRQRLFDGEFQAEFERGRIEPDEFHRQVLGDAAATVDPDALRIAASDIFTLNPGMPAILDAIREKRIRLVLLSNTSVWHYEWVKSEFDVLSRFDAAVTSFQAGAIKPETGIYEAALKTIDCSPQECFYTDDIAEYVETGRSFGLNAEVFTDSASLLRHLAGHGIELNVETLSTDHR